ncbi:MAG: phosphoribosylglycinamide formyltransferase [Gillisia sp.]
MKASTSNPAKKIVIFASGSGTNAENIIKYFNNTDFAKVIAVFSNKRSAKVLERAHKLNIKALHFDRESFYETNEVLNLLCDMKPDLIVLAGFLWLFPSKILKKFPKKVINIHPALLPKYGGKGMYGDLVHQSVIANGDTSSGITIHYVNENYDEGSTIFQTTLNINEEDTPSTLAKRIHDLEYLHFPKTIETLLQKQSN